MLRRLSDLANQPLARHVAGGLTLLGGLFAGYALQIEPRWPEIVRLELPLPNLPRQFDGLTLVQISDLHAGAAFPSTLIRRSVDLVNAFGADMIAITGDLFQSTPQDARMCAEALSALRAPLGVYLVMGNHERRIAPEYGEKPFRRPEFCLLCNAAHRLAVDGASLWLVGVDDVLMRLGDLGSALRGVPPEACKILLVHEPDFADQIVRSTRTAAPACGPIDLQLSGHTHGGQVRLPGVGPLLLPVLGRRYPMGLYRLNGMWLYTNRGLGVAPPPVRLFCRPEITLFTLRNKDAAAGC
ncbi:MAG: metallophosphoesterase [Anaerolineae bacterium]|nr:metallophosphoesterase [Anaerolineae bacterium]